ncbi:hypothetical protein HOY82DRAFT_603936 [Tuber indicum]|nr:hypothetical protein HOY82DRAFT_603936 [Tuber indicum]
MSNCLISSPSSVTLKSSDTQVASPALQLPKGTSTCSEVNKHSRESEEGSDEGDSNQPSGEVQVKVGKRQRKRRKKGSAKEEGPYKDNVPEAKKGVEVTKTIQPAESQSTGIGGDQDQRLNHNILIAASGLHAVIFLDPRMLLKSSMTELVDATTAILATSQRTAQAISYGTTPTIPSHNQSLYKSDPSPSLLLLYKSEEAVEQALGPISILGYSCKVERFREGKHCVFKIRLGYWASDVKKLRNAFEVQTRVEAIAWGWRVVNRTRTHLVIKTRFPRGRIVIGIKIDGWWLDYEKEEKGTCCCCAGTHSPFEMDAKCSQFELE